jgi:hypothetical protein
MWGDVTIARNILIQGVSQFKRAVMNEYEILYGPIVRSFMMEARYINAALFEEPEAPWRQDLVVVVAARQQDLVVVDQPNLGAVLAAEDMTGFAWNLGRRAYLSAQTKKRNFATNIQAPEYDRFLGNLTNAQRDLYFKCALTLAAKEFPTLGCFAAEALQMMNAKWEQFGAPKYNEEHFTDEEISILKRERNEPAKILEGLE